MIKSFLIKKLLILFLNDKFRYGLNPALKLLKLNICKYIDTVNPITINFYYFLVLHKYNKLKDKKINCISYSYYISHYHI